jgi:hypothetical protein
VSRDLETAADTALQAGHVVQVVFVELDFSSGFLRCTTAAYDFSWNGYTWLGLGQLGTIEPIEEGGQLEARGVAMTLSGIPASMISTALGEHYQGRACRLWFGQLNATTRAVVADPVGPVSFRMDTMAIELGDTATIRLTAESRLVDWDRPRSRRFNDADQKLDYPEDQFFNMVEEMVEKTIVW